MDKPKLFTLLFLLVFTVSLQAQENDIELSTQSASTIPQKISYQGMLTDNNGDPLHGNFTMEFAFYTTSSGGTAIWNEEQSSVSVENGIFNVLLGSNESLTNLAFDEPYWLGITVNGDLLSPRIELASSAYSLNTVRIQGKPIASDNPSNGDLLGWSGTKWEPTSPPSITETDPTWSGSANTSGDIGRTGKVGIGTTSPTSLLEVQGGSIRVTPPSGKKIVMQLRNSDGSRSTFFDQLDTGEFVIDVENQLVLSPSNRVLAFNTSRNKWVPIRAEEFQEMSSREIKHNIIPLESNDAEYWLEKLLSFKPATYLYTWQDDSEESKFGFIAEEMPSILTSRDGKSVNLLAVSTAITAAVQALHDKIEQTRCNEGNIISKNKTINAEQQSEFDKLRERIEYLEALILKSTEE